MVTLSRKAWPAAPPRVELWFALPRPGPLPSIRAADLHQARGHDCGALHPVLRGAVVTWSNLGVGRHRGLQGHRFTVRMPQRKHDRQQARSLRRTSDTEIVSPRSDCAMDSSSSCSSSGGTTNVRRLHAPTRYHLPLTRQANKTSEQSGHPDRAQCTAGRPLPAGAKAVSTRATCSPSCTRLC